jgi:DNA-binding IscR family transcriptional regulator
MNPVGKRKEDISLLDIVEAVEGKCWIGDCLLGLDNCADQKTCPTHALWQRVRGEITEALRNTTLAEVITLRDSNARARQRRRLNRLHARSRVGLAQNVRAGMLLKHR